MTPGSPPLEETEGPPSAGRPPRRPPLAHAALRLWATVAARWKTARAAERTERTRAFRDALRR